MCAGVQKLSRPIDMCHEMSQCPPIKLEVIPPITNQTVQGIDSTVADARSPARAYNDCPRGMLSAMFAGSSRLCCLEVFAQTFPTPKVYTVAPFWVNTMATVMSSRQIGMPGHDGELVRPAFFS